MSLLLDDDSAAKWRAVHDASALLGLDSFPEPVVTLVDETPADRVFLAVRLLEEGITRLAIGLVRPEPRVVSRAAKTVSFDPETVYAVGKQARGTLMLVEIARTNTGLQLGFRYLLAG